MYMNRMLGPYAVHLLGADPCNIADCRSFCGSGEVRLNFLAVWILSLIINLGMWLERFVIVITSLHRDFVPSSWGMYYPTIWDIGTYIGTIGLFLTMMFLFIRGLPAISIFEVREEVHHKAAKHGD